MNAEGPLVGAGLLASGIVRKGERLLGLDRLFVLLVERAFPVVEGRRACTFSGEPGVGLIGPSANQPRGPARQLIRRDRKWPARLSGPIAFGIDDDELLGLDRLFVLLVERAFPVVEAPAIHDLFYRREFEG